MTKNLLKKNEQNYMKNIKLKIITSSKIHYS